MVGRGCSQPRRRFIVSDGLDRKYTPYGVDALPIELLDRELWHEEWNQEATYLRMTIERATLFVKHAATFLTFQLENHQHIEEVFGASCTPYVYSRLRSRAWAWALAWARAGTRIS
jgi:hypothetical protein